MRFLFFLLIASISVLSALAQVGNPGEILERTKTPQILNQLHINQDPRLDKLLNWHIEKNKKINGIEGFRVEIFSSSALNARELAENTKVDFLSKYSENIVYVKYFAPNFKVRVGDFRTKNEALKLLQRIKKTYPASFIVSDIIEFPLLKPLNYERSN